jgi:CrcB protein
MNSALAVFIGGGLGCVARYGISLAVKYNYAAIFPIATLLSNMLSCLILALAVGYFADKISANGLLYTFVIVGFCGGFSTFSSFSYETIHLLKNGNLIYALLNIAVSIISCFCIVYFLSKK